MYMDTPHAQILAYETIIKQETRLHYDHVLGKRKLEWMDPKRLATKYSDRMRKIGLQHFCKENESQYFTARGHHHI